MPAGDANIVELQPGQDAQRDTLPTTTAAATDWSGWDRWLRSHLNIEIANLHTALGTLLAAERRKLETKTRELERELAKLSGMIDVLRGAQPPPVPKFPSVKAWSDGTVYHAGDIVALTGGGCYQATRDTARAPGAKDWVCLAASGKTIVGPSGRSLTIRGTHDANAIYERFDVVMLNGSSFVALRDAPGPCPGGNWHLLASCGKRGQRGITGLRGERGAAGANIQSWSVDRSRYTATPIMTDGSIGPTLNLRGLFEQFFAETSNG